jgi:hypothetical protein
MMNVQLETRTGDLVTTGRVPPFNEPPEVLLWGVRVFRLHDKGDGMVRPTIYREAFATYLIDSDN